MCFDVVDVFDVCGVIGQAKKLHLAVADLRMPPIVDFAASPMKEKEWCSLRFKNNIALFLYHVLLLNDGVLVDLAFGFV